MESNVRVLFPEEVNVGETLEMLEAHHLAVKHARGACAGGPPSYHLAVQDLVTNTLHFGQGYSYNQVLTHTCNKALRQRAVTLRK